MSNNPQICGLMLAYFHAEMTLQCLKTLEHQGIATIVLVDNSADANEHQQTLELAKSFPEGWLKVIIAPENLGFAKGMNLAWQHAQRLDNWNYYLILNNDILASSNLVKNLTNYFKENPSTALLSVNANTNKNTQSGFYYHRLSGLIFKKPFLGSFKVASGYCLMIPSKEILNILFNPTFFMYGEDVELSWQKLKQNKKVHILEQSLITHMSSQSSQEGSFFYEYHTNRGHWLLVQILSKNKFERLFMYLLRIFILMIRAFIRSIRYRCFIPFKAYFRALSNKVI